MGTDCGTPRYRKRECGLRTRNASGSGGFIRKTQPVTGEQPQAGLPGGNRLIRIGIPFEKIARNDHGNQVRRGSHISPLKQTGRQKLRRPEQRRSADAEAADPASGNIIENHRLLMNLQCAIPLQRGISAENQTGLIPVRIPETVVELPREEGTPASLVELLFFQ